MAIGEVKATFREEFNTGFTAEITGSLEWDGDEEKRTGGRGGGVIQREDTHFWQWHGQKPRQ